MDVSDRPGVPESNVFTKAYYAFGLFVLGGLDLGTPSQGPLFGKVLLWIAYFGAPVLTASAVIEALVHVLQPHSWRMRHINNHIVIAGSGKLTFSFLKKIREQDRSRPILVLASEADQTRLDEMQSYNNIRIILIASGDHRFLMRRLRMDRAYKILLLTEDDLVNCEAATNIIATNPALASKVIFHVADLRMLRILQDTNIAKKCTSFNAYQMAATQLAREMLIKRFNSTQYNDTVVFAGFGRFGQSILEELEQHAAGAFCTVAIIDNDAKRNTLIADEQIGKDKDYIRHVIEGDIDDPGVWNRLFKAVITVGEEPVFILSTGSDEQNLRAAIWLRQQFKDALIISRTLWSSAFATEVCKEHNIYSVNRTELMEEAIPRQWYLD